MSAPGSALVSRVLGSRDDYLMLAPPEVDGTDTPLPLGRPLDLIYRLQGYHYELAVVLVASPSATANVYVARSTAAPVRRDRRRAERIRVRVPVQFAPSSGPALAGQTVDLSSGGALLEMEHPPCLGECGSIALDLDSSGLLRCAAEVLRIQPGTAGRPPSVAVAFRHIPVGDRRRFLRFLVISGRSDGPRSTPGAN